MSSWFSMLLKARTTKTFIPLVLWQLLVNYFNMIQLPFTSMFIWAQVCSNRTQACYRQKNKNKTISKNRYHKWEYIFFFPDIYSFYCLIAKGLIWLIMGFHTDKTIVSWKNKLKLHSMYLSYWTLKLCQTLYYRALVIYLCDLHWTESCSFLLLSNETETNATYH